MNSKRLLVRVLMKPGCEACNAPSYIVKRLKLKYDFDVKFINIMERKYSREYADYKTRLPLVFVDDQILEGTISEVEIKNLFEKYGVGNFS